MRDVLQFTVDVLDDSVFPSHWSVSFAAKDKMSQVTSKIYILQCYYITCKSFDIIYKNSNIVWWETNAQLYMMHSVCYYSVDTYSYFGLFYIWNVEFILDLGNNIIHCHYSMCNYPIVGWSS